jgi:tetratricopeptide (TPR) repeat protein
MQKYFASLLFVLLIASCKTGEKTVAAKSEKKKNIQPTQLDKNTEAKLERLQLEAEKAKVIEDWESAAKNYNDVLAIDPNNANAHFQLAQVFMQQGKTADAEQEATKAALLDAGNKWYLEMLASIYMSENKAKEAIETYKTLLQKFPNNPEYYQYLGYLQTKTGQLENAIKTYDLYQKNFGIDENAVMEKKNIYLRLNRFNDAVAEIHKLVDAFPGEPDYLMMEAELYRANRMKEKAIEIYKQVLIIEPDNANALLAMAELGMQTGNTQESNENIRKIFENPKVDVDSKIKLLLPYLQFWDLKKDRKQDAFELAEILTAVHPENSSAFSIKGDLLYLDNQNDKALEAYVKSLSLNKDVFQVWQQVMVIYNLKKDWTNLQKTCNEAMEFFPNQSIIYLFKGGAEQQNKEFEKALKSYSKGEKMSADNDKLRAQFLSNLGDVYHSLGKLTESDSAYERSLKLDPENAYVLNNYSYYLSIRKTNLEKAKQMSAYANKLDPENSSFLDTYAWILFQLNDFANAKEWQEKAMKAGGDKSGTIIEHYGDILYQLGKKEEAVSNWKKAKELGTDSGSIDKKIALEKYEE